MFGAIKSAVKTFAPYQDLIRKGWRHKIKEVTRTLVVNHNKVASLVPGNKPEKPECFALSGNLCRTDQAS